MQPKRFHCTKKQGNPRIDVNKMSEPGLVKQFAAALEQELSGAQSGDSATDKWEALCDTMHCTALATFGKKTSKSHYCYEAKSTEITPTIEAKRIALAEYKRSPSEINLHILRTARSRVQQTARRCANEYLTELNENIQTAATTGNIRGMYDGIKKALGPVQSKTTPLNPPLGK